LKPNLLITTSTLPNEPHDPEPRFVLDLAVALGRHFNVCVLAPRNPGVRPIDEFGGVEVRRYAYAPLRTWETLTYPGATLERLRHRPVRWGLVPLLMAGLYRETRRLLSERNFACVHAHWLMPQGAVQALALSGKSLTPYVAVAHGADVHAMNGVVATEILRRAVSRASGVVSASQLLSETLYARFPSEMAARPTTVIGTGVDTDKFSPSLRAEEWAAAHGVSRPVILYVGRLSEKKGVEFLLTAMATEPLRSTKASLVVIGRGPLGDRLHTLCADLDLGSRVRFLPPCDHATLSAHIAAADVLCLPSVVTRGGDQEGRPTVLVEAASCGVPAVASDVGGVRDWIDHGRNGLLVPPGDPSALAEALAGLLSQPENIRQMGKSARQKALQTSWSAVADRYAEFTHQAIASQEEKALRTR
jgi:glycosyltransferase involved in cell wall biosynthesis